MVIGFFSGVVETVGDFRGMRNREGFTHPP